MCARLSDAGAQEVGRGTAEHSFSPSQSSESANPARLGRAAFIPVMEPANFRKLHNRSEFRRLYPPRDRRILF